MNYHERNRSRSLEKKRKEIQRRLNDSSPWLGEDDDGDDEAFIRKFYAEQGFNSQSQRVNRNKQGGYDRPNNNNNNNSYYNNNNNNQGFFTQKLNRSFSKENFGNNNNNRNRNNSGNYNNNNQNNKGNYNNNNNYYKKNYKKGPDGVITGCEYNTVYYVKCTSPHCNSLHAEGTKCNQALNQ